MNKQSLMPSPLKIILLLLLLLSSQIAAAKINHATKNMQMVGEATLSVLFWDIYHSQLFTPNGNYQTGDYPLALNIHYLRDIDAQDLLERTVQEWDKLGFKATQYQAWVKQLQQIWPNIKQGDQLTLHITAAQQSDFYFNQNKIGSVQDQRFGQQFVAIWLDEKCSFPHIRKQLLGIN